MIGSAKSPLRNSPLLHVGELTAQTLRRGRLGTSQVRLQITLEDSDCYPLPDGHYMNTYFFKGGFAVRVWL